MPVMSKKARYVLVAEDDASYARLYALKLKKEGLNVQVVKNGVEAMQAAKKQTPALILLDLMMPVQDGFETLRQMHEDPVLAKVKKIVFSNLGQVEDQTKAKELGATAYFVKAETSVQEIVRSIRDSLS